MSARRTTATPTPEQCAEALREVARRLGVLALSKPAYLAYRRRVDPSLPHVSTIVKRFGSWPQALRAAGLQLTERGGQEVERLAGTRGCPYSKEEVVAALRAAAEAQHTTQLSTVVYEEYRQKSAPQLPSSSAIRKWLGGWASACELAGLSAPPTGAARATRERLAAGRLQMLDALRAAWWAIDRELTEQRYSAWREARRGRGFAAGAAGAAGSAAVGCAPHCAADIVRAFGGWEKALAGAGILDDGAFHSAARERAGDPALMWTVRDVRRLVRAFATRHGGTLPSAKVWCPPPGSPTPPWEVVCDLMPPTPWVLG